MEDQGAPGGVARFAAHRVVVAACSGVLRQLLRQLPHTAPLRVEASSCQSGAVFEVALRFLYGAEVVCDFLEDPALLFQLLCLCTRYALPQPLARYARSSLFRTLAARAHHAALLLQLLRGAEEFGLDAAEGASLLRTDTRKGLPGNAA